MWKLITERVDDLGGKHSLRLFFVDIDDVRSFVDFCIDNINPVKFVLEREEIDFDT